MFSDESVFRENWIPRRLQHRDDEQEALSDALRPAEHGAATDDIALSGSSGVGKTVLATVQVEELRLAADITVGEIRCIGKRSGSVLRAAVREHPRGSDPAHNTPVDDVREELAEITTKPYLVVLDEADDVSQGEVLEWFADIENVSFMAICHDYTDWAGHLSKSASRGLRHVPLDGYSVDELVDILTARADLGLRLGALTTGLLEDIARRSGGKARTAIQTLYEAALIASDRRLPEIKAEVVPEASHRARERIRLGNLSSLPEGHLLCYHIIQQAGGGGLSASEFKTRYEQVAPRVFNDEHELTPASEATRWRYLKKLEDYDLVGIEGENRHKQYFALDTSLEVPDSVTFDTEIGLEV